MFNEMQMSQPTLSSGKPKFQNPPGLAADTVGVLPEGNKQNGAEIVAEQEGFHQEGPESLYGYTK